MIDIIDGNAALIHFFHFRRIFILRILLVLLLWLMQKNGVQI